MPLIGTEVQDYIVKTKLVESKFVYNSENTEIEDANPDERERFNRKENRKRILKNIVTGRWMSRN